MKLGEEILARKKVRAQELPNTQANGRFPATAIRENSGSPFEAAATPLRKFSDTLSIQIELSSLILNFMIPLPDMHWNYPSLMLNQIAHIEKFSRP